MTDVARNILVAGLRKLLAADGTLPFSQLTASQAYELRAYAARTGAIRHVSREQGRAIFIAIDRESVERACAVPVAPAVPKTAATRALR